MTTGIEIRDEGRRYAAYVDGLLAGTLVYRRREGVIVLVHTEVDPAFEGRGVGSALARQALDEARSAGVRVDPRCPFVRAFLARHPEYAGTAGAVRPRPEHVERDQA